jgi:hypothetical protein
MNFIFKVSVFSVSVLCCFSHLSASHNASRYFPFIERSENYLPKKKSFLSNAIFFTTAATAFRRGGGNSGIPELWGNYDLWNVVNSLEKVSPTGDSFVKAIKTDLSAYEEKSLHFHVDGKVKSKGIMINYEHNFNWNGISAGIHVPLMYVSSTSRYSFNRSALISAMGWNPSEYEGSKGVRLNDKIDNIRRLVHDKIGFIENDWGNGGIGDLDVYARWNYFMDHQFMTRGINFGIQLGTMIPSGVKRNLNQPVSVSFMGAGHWGLYGDFISEFELKQDLKVGLIAGGIYQLASTRNVRIPVFKEPEIFSALVGKMKLSPGITAKLSPYLTIDNIKDGVSFQARYSYLRHNQDSLKDARADKLIKCFLSYTDASEKDISDNIEQKNNLSKWRSHYLTLQLNYDSKKALNNWAMNPNFYFSYDMPISGNGICKTHQINLGLDLHF